MHSLIWTGCWVKKKYLAGFSRVHIKDTAKFEHMLLHPKLAVIAETFSEISAYYNVHMHSYIRWEHT